MKLPSTLPLVEHWIYIHNEPPVGSLCFSQPLQQKRYHKVGRYQLFMFNFSLNITRSLHNLETSSLNVKGWPLIHLFC
jgi:hypothetical protein